MSSWAHSLLTSGGDTEDGLPFLLDSKGKKIYLSSSTKISLYRRGIDKRLDELASQYRLTTLLSSECLAVIDVGANVGEIGMLISRRRHFSYFAFEPDPFANRALLKNVPQGLISDCAVGDREGLVDFFLEPDTADSSLLELHDPKEGIIRVNLTTIDVALGQVEFPLQIDILKVEAEGLEPEVLRGALRTLKRTKFCVVDAGPERYGKSTAAECLSILQASGFELHEIIFPRGVLVCRRTESAN